MGCGASKVVEAVVEEPKKEAVLDGETIGKRKAPTAEAVPEGVPETTVSSIADPPEMLQEQKVVKVASPDDDTLSLATTDIEPEPVPEPPAPAPEPAAAAPDEPAPVPEPAPEPPKPPPEPVVELPPGLNPEFAGLFHYQLKPELQTTIKIRKMLSVETDPPIDKVVQHPAVVLRLVEFLKREQHPQLVFESAWALTNVASGTHLHTMHVLGAGAVPEFVRLVNHPHAAHARDIQDQALWALGNIAGDSTECRDVVLAAGGLSAVLQLLQTPDLPMSLVANGTWAISNLCRGKPAPHPDITSPAVPMVASLVLNYSDEEVMTDANWALSYLSDGDSARIQAIVDSGVVPRLADILGTASREARVLAPILRTLGNIVTGDDQQTDAVIASGALPHLLSLATDPNVRASIRKEATWALSNILAGTNSQKQAAIDAGVVPAMVTIVTINEAAMEVRKEAAWAVENACSGDEAQVQQLVSTGVLSAIKEILTWGTTGYRPLVHGAFDALENVLVAGEKLKKAQGTDENPFKQAMIDCGLYQMLDEWPLDDETMYSKAQHVMMKFFPPPPPPEPVIVIAEPVVEPEPATPSPDPKDRPVAAGLGGGLWWGGLRSSTKAPPELPPITTVEQTQLSHTSVIDQAIAALRESQQRLGTTQEAAQPETPATPPPAQTNEATESGLVHDLAGSPSEYEVPSRRNTEDRAADPLTD